MSQLPDIFRVRQHFEAPQLDDVPVEVEAQLKRLSLGGKIKSGESVAITAGSRGIAGIHEIIKAIAGHLTRLGAKPFIVPAMGSHGGGSAEGQRRIVESYGITEEFCGCPIRASMETVTVCDAREGFPVHFDQHAYSADHVVVCNRVKSHTGFAGDIESGLMKMMLIGLGKHAGALIYHRAIKDYSFGQIVRSVAKEVLSKCSVLAGVAIVENCNSRTAKIEAVAPEDFEDREKALLLQAKEWMPRLPFKAVDVLVLDEIGKNVSGAGLDPNVVGRKALLHRAAEHEYPKVRLIAVRDITPESHGNACGVGLVEFCRSRIIEKMDVDSTRVNVLTGGLGVEAMIPLHYQTDREMLDIMMTQIGLTEPVDSKLLWVRSTNAVGKVECSQTYLEEARDRDDLEILTDLRPLSFDETGNLSDEHMLVS